MKLALLGFGKMGKMVEKAAAARGHHICARFSNQIGLAYDNPHLLEQADVAIDFSEGNTVIPHLKLCLQLNKPFVVGTTGWDDQFPLAKKLVAESNGAFLYAPNFSIGIYLFQQITAYAASLFQPFHEYDISGIEIHHSAKTDQPSGTAKAITGEILKKVPRIKSFNFSSVRSGHFPGTHTLHFDCDADTLTLSHQARNREGFAAGAILAAEWLINKKGFFTFQDVMNSYLGDIK